MVFSVQYLRGIAALMVLLEHTAAKSAQYSTNVLSGWHIGGAGVDLFFLVSGFIMCHTTTNKHQQKGASRQFLWRRVLRIIPLYWLVTCAALLVFLIAPDKINSQGGDTQILASFFLLPTDGLYLVSNGWTLRYEFLFYMIFMLGLFFSKRIGQVLVISMIAALVLWGQLQAADNAVTRFITDALLLEFAAGMALYHIYSAYQRLDHPPSMLPFVLLGIALGSLFAVNQGINSEIRVIDFGLPMACAMAGLLCLESSLRQQPIQWLKMLGDSSYAMYLTHPFILAGGAMIFSKLHLHTALSGFAFTGLLLAISIIAGYLVYEWLEKPIGRKISSMMSPDKDRKTVITPSPRIVQNA